MMGLTKIGLKPSRFRACGILWAMFVDAYESG